MAENCLKCWIQHNSKQNRIELCPRPQENLSSALERKIIITNRILYQKILNATRTMTTAKEG